MREPGRGTASFARGVRGCVPRLALLLVLATTTLFLTLAIGPTWGNGAAPSAPAVKAPHAAGGEPAPVAAPSAADPRSGMAAKWTPGSGPGAIAALHYRMSTVSGLASPCPSYVYGDDWMTYDSVDQSIWATNPAGCVDEINPGATGWGWNLTTSLPVGTSPFGVAFDNATQDLFVSNTGSDNVTVISTTNDSPVASIAVGSRPYGVAYDWAAAEVFVANGGSGNVSVISDSTLRVVASIGVGVDPVGVAADPVSGQVFVANRGSDNISILSDSLHRVVGSVGAGAQPYGVAIDNTTDQAFVTNEGSNNLTVVNASTDSLGGTVPVLAPAGDLQGIAYDSADGLFWVGAGWSVAVVVNASTLTVAGYAGTDPSGVAYDPANGAICLSNTANLSFACVTVNFAESTQLVTVHETGLPLGVTWGLRVNESYTPWNSTTQFGSGTNITFGAWYGFGAGPETYEFAVLAPPGFVSVPATGSFSTGNWLNHSYAISVNVSFHAISSAYRVSFVETGLPSGTPWVVTLAGWQNRTTGTTNSFLEGNGSYDYSIGVTGGYSPVVGSGIVVVQGSNLTVNVTFTIMPEYTVRFDETGLANGTYWSVWFGGATASSPSSSIAFNVTNGTYAYTAYASGYVALSPTGNVTVLGMPLTVNLTFENAPYAVTFFQHSLPSGTPWEVSLNGVRQTGWSTVSFAEPNGTYPFSVAPALNLTPFPSEGNVTVQGQDVNITVTFLTPPPEINVTFEETGLPLGVSWLITLGNTTERSVGSSIWFEVAAGTYPIAIGNVTGFAGSGPAYVTIPAGTPSLTLGVTFTPEVYALTFHETGLPNGTGWGVTIGSAIESSLTSNVTFAEPSGSYGYVVLAVPGFVTQFSGTATVADHDTLVVIAFSPQTYPIEFVEFGLPAGTNWSVTVANASAGFNVTRSTTSNAIVFFLPNGTYSVTFGLPPGFTGAPSGGSVVVAGRAADGPTLSVSSPASGSSEFVSGSWAMLAVGVAVGLGAGFVAGWFLRRPPPVAPATGARRITEPRTPPSP